MPASRHTDMLEARALWSTAPPEPRSRVSNWPTVLFSWWCTSCACIIILTRLCGRKVRSDKLFREDKIMALSLIPLWIRMALVHFVLIYGTNNVNTVDHTYTPTQLYHHSIGARLVLASRIFYAMFIWLNKLTVSEFLKRITIRVWRKEWEYTLQGIRIFLFVTFGGVVIATLSECQPFNHYWQVVPDPGPHCRQGFAQLLVMGSADIVTDILLIAFPIPVVLSSGQGWKRKLQMGSLFSLSILMIAVTATRMPMVIMHQGRQQYRTVWASCEILASAAVSNAVILGSFLRDKGTKKNKYRAHSSAHSVEGGVLSRRPTLTTLQSVDSDEDLFRTYGLGRMPEHLQDETVSSPRLAPPALPASRHGRHGKSPSHAQPLDTNRHATASDSEESLHKASSSQPLPSPSPSTSQSVNFFDVGHLLGGSERSIASQATGTLVESGSPTVVAHDFATLSSPIHFRAGSQRFFRDVGDILNRRESGNNSPARQNSYRGSDGAPIGILVPMLERHDTQMSLQDPGGLLPTRTNNRPSTGQERYQNDPGWPPLSHSPLPPNAQVHEDDIELDEIGGLEGDDRPERVAVSLQEMLRRENESRGQHSIQDTRRQQGTFDDMILNDAGGLMRR